MKSILMALSVALMPVTVNGQSWSNGYDHYLGKGADQEVIEKAAISPEDKALAAKAKPAADTFLTYFDNSEFQKAADMSFEREKAPVPGARKKDVRKSTRVNASLLAASANMYYNLGGMQNRKLVGVTVEETFNSMPDAKYVIFKYEAKFRDQAETQNQYLVVKMSGDQAGTVIAFPHKL